MSTPEQEFPGSRSSHPKYVFRYTSHEDGDQFAQGVARRRFRAIVDDRDPKVEKAWGQTDLKFISRVFLSQPTPIGESHDRMAAHPPSLARSHGSSLQTVRAQTPESTLS